MDEQGQEALLIQQEAARSSFRRRTTTTTKSILLPNDDDSISKESFEKALLARRTLEGSSMSEELKLVLNDAVQKGLAAVERRELDRAKQLLEFIIVPTSLNGNDDRLPQVDTVSSLGFDRSFDVRHPTDVLSMSSLNEILDAPLTPEQKQARFRVFWFGNKHHNKKTIEAEDDSTTSPERFVTTVVCNEGITLPGGDEEADDGYLHRIEEELRDALDDLSTHKSVTSADGVPLHTPPREFVDRSLDAAEIMDHLLNESTTQNEVSFISIETTAHEEEAPRPRSQSPLKRLLQRRSSKKTVLVEECVEAPGTTNPVEDVAPKEPEEPPTSVSPSTAVGHHIEDEDRYKVDSMESNEPEEEPQEPLESDALDAEDRYAVPADPCSFCDSLFRQPQSLQRQPSEQLALADRAEEPAVIDKYAEMPMIQNDENVNRDKNVEHTSAKKKIKKRFALFRRRKTKATRVPSDGNTEPIVPKKPLQGILKAPSKSFPVDETASVENSVPVDGGSTSTVTSHDDEVEPDPLLDRLKQHQRGLEPGPPQQQPLDP